MDRIKKQHFTPLMSFSLVLTAGIITAKYSYDYLSMRHWLAISILPWSIAACCYMMTQLIRRHNPSSRIIDKLIHYQCLNLYLCIFCLGSCITTHHIDHLNAPVQIKAYQSLSSFERTILKAQDFRLQA